MASLMTLDGPCAGREFPLESGCSVIGRQPDVAVQLESLAVSRQHAQIVCEGSACYVEDLGSSNGTYVNGQRIEGRQLLTEQDTLQLGPYVFALRNAPFVEGDEPIIRASVAALPSNHTLFVDNPGYKLQVVLEIAQQLARTPDELLLGELLDHLLILFAQADRGLVVLCEGEQLVERAYRLREPLIHGRSGAPAPFSRTLVRRALEGGVGILSEDVPRDKQMLIQTVLSLKVRSLLCVPLICKDGRRLGVIQLDCSRPGTAFRQEDLEVLTAIGMQVAVVLDNAALHAERLRDERLRIEVGMARDIQRGFLPVNFPSGAEGFELFASVEPAHEVSGDLYDFFRLADGRLAFYVGDVSGKGMPAALFMVVVHALFRHLTLTENAPAATLSRLDAALAADNATDRFVTVAHGLYDPPTGRVNLAVAAHPLPLLRRSDGRVEEIAVRPGLPLGYGQVGDDLAECQLTLAPGETLILYTDGFTEARMPSGQSMFDQRRFREILGGPRTSLSLQECAAAARAAVAEFTGASEQQDDLTLLLLRRK
jgi:serine phosphatase RsbU (regulator of sigma subunit)